MTEHGFSPDWLSLREPYDHQARSARLTERLGAILRHPDHRPVRIMDLACGHGSTLRYLSPRLPSPQQWTLVDHDQRLLDWIAQRPPPDGATVTLRRHDLSSELEDIPFKADAVVTSALLDLVSQEWLQRLAAHCTRWGVPFLAALTVDGRVQFSPEDPRDADVMRWFRAHQRTDRGFGPSPGFQAADVTAGLLEQAGMTVYTARADWNIPPGDQAMMAEMVRGIASASAECSPRPQEVRRWEVDRLRAVKRGQISLIVDHTDLLALPVRSGENG